MGDQFHTGGLCSSSSWWGGIAAVRTGSGGYGPVVGIAPSIPLFSCPSIDGVMIMRSSAAPFVEDILQDPMVGTGLTITPEISQYQEQMLDYGNFTACSRDDFSWSNPKFLLMETDESSCADAAAAASIGKEACSTTPLASFEQQLHVGLQAAGMDPSSQILDPHSQRSTSIYSDVPTTAGACAPEKGLVLDDPVNVSVSAASSGSCNDVPECYRPPLNHDLSPLQQQLIMNQVHPDQHDHSYQISRYETSYYSSMQAAGSHLIDSLPQTLEEGKQPIKTCGASIKRKSDSDGTRSSGSTRKKNSSRETSPSAAKKPRIEVPSPLPTFNVRKEKLQDRVTALQQLVSPFGKTDTASVLHEAIEYIKFLHGQVQVLSAPYLTGGQSAQHQQNYTGDSNNDNNQDMGLRSRGLCLVPISSTFVVANEPVANYWTSIFGGSTY